MLSAQDTTRSPVACAGQRIDAITIVSSAPSVARLRRVPIVAEIARSVHVTTRTEIIERFMLLRVGDVCEELRRAESERILRAQPFLADASITVFSAPDGAVELEVRTIDENSLLAGGRLSAKAPVVQAMRLGSANLNGSAVLLEGSWRNGGAYRDELGLRLIDHQLLGRPYVLDTELRRRSLGSVWRVEGTHPFFTDIQRIAWRARAGADERYVGFERDGLRHALRGDRSFFDVGGIVRIGPPGRLSLFGASFSGDRERPGDAPVFVTDQGLRPDTASLLIGRYTEHRIARVNALWGVRDIGFVRVQGFDALTATQDVPVGFQLGSMFGRSLSILGAHDDDIFMASEAYAGVAGPAGAFRLQLRGEGRRDNKMNRWDGILTAGRAAQYIKFGDAQTVTLSAEWSGGWRGRLPFAFTLADRNGGVRGFPRATEPGGQRLVARFEDRQNLGRAFDLADVGVAVFSDVGQQWAGDVPYGVTTRPRGSVGVSLLAAVPPRSARVWRLDLAVPTTPGYGRRVELRLSSADRTAFFWPEPRDVGDTRENTVPTSIFGWP